MYDQPRACGAGVSSILAVVTFFKLTVAVVLGFVFVAGCSSSGPGNAKVPAGAKSSGGNHATIDTTAGPIEIEFFESTAPRAVENFRLLAEHGYYNGLTFHRVVKGFMVQGGD